MEFIQTYVETILNLIDWRTFFDVPIIAIGIFLLYHILRSSGAWRIVLGIFIAFAIFVIARIFEFSTVIWIYSNLSGVSLIALIIIFQPEIRKTFEKTASTFRFKNRQKEEKKLSRLIVNAVNDLKEKKRGAIVVLPGKEEISSHISGGIRINAEPSVPLIASIFDPHSSGHDGAMIIEKGMISQFAVRLPLSISNKLSQEFGTRHHASLGLSEVSDAFIITVSEERGTITTFQNSQAESVVNINKLADAIEEHWVNASSIGPQTGKKKRRGMVIVEISLSLITAFILWSDLTLSSSRIKSTSVTIPIEYIMNTNKLAIIGEKPVTVIVKLNGSVSDLNRIQPDLLKATIDLRKAAVGENTVSISNKNVILPQGISLTDADPSNFTVTVYSTEEKEVIVKPQVVGTLPDNLEIESIEISPNTLKIYYASDAGKNEEISISTTPVYLQNITEDTKLLCKLIIPQDIYPTMREWPDAVVTIKVKQAPKPTVKPR